jgi:hypothetical protein
MNNLSSRKKLFLYIVLAITSIMVDNYMEIRFGYFINNNISKTGIMVLLYTIVYRKDIQKDYGI